MMNLCVSKNYSYIHILSGEDYPVVNCREIFEFFDNSNSIYCDYSLINNKKHNAFKRYNYYWLYTRFHQNYKNEIIRAFNLIFIALQIIFPIYNRRKIGNIKNIYWGFVWGSYPMYAIEFILNYMRYDKEFLKDLSSCKIPEELCFQTILMNSKYKDAVENNNLRYWNMVGGDGSGPVYLTTRDLKKIDAANVFFARKFEPGSEILQILMERQYFGSKSL